MKRLLSLDIVHEQSMEARERAALLREESLELLLAGRRRLELTRERLSALAAKSSE